VIRPTLLVVCAVTAAGLLAACSDRIVTSGHAVPVADKTPDPVAEQTAPKNIGERVASATLDDQSLGEIRGGFSTDSGLVVNFSFQEATYVNHNLAQNIVIPTLTVSPGSNTASMAGSFTPGAVASIANTTQSQVSSPTQAVQSIINSGMTSIVSNLSKGGISNVVSNTANNQLVQQMITANVGITGLSQAMQQSVASTVMSRVMAANSQFR
jgi:hypothetical protein